jgi:signal transduction histidine kinase
MKSIGRSLIFYFLLLLAVSVGSLSLLAYKSIQSILNTKEAARRELLQSQHEKACGRECARLDRLLLMQAHTLASHAQFQMRRTRGLFLAPLSLLSAGLDSNSVLLAPIWLTEGTRTSCTDYIHRIFLTRIEFNEELLPPLAEGRVTEYFQINGSSGAVWRSRSLGEESLPIHSDVIRTAKLHEPRFDHTEIGPGIAVRLVTLKVPAARVVVIRGPGAEYPPRNEMSPPHPEPVERPPRALFIQCAAETTERDAALAALQNELDEHLANLEKESAATLANLRNWIGAITSVTFIALFVGCFWLVRAGLAPLRRLSIAVGRVSPKDFSLAMESQGLPAEIQPVVDRLRATLELLQSAFEREKHAAADISHELRTPVAALLTTLEVGLRKSRSPEEYRELLAECHAAGQQMSHLVERLLTLARLDSGVDGLRPEEIDVTLLAEECVELVRPLARAGDLSLSISRNGPAIVRTDSGKLREIVINLLHNAIDYNRPAGSVELIVGERAGRIDLEVRDTGIGITAESCRHIFERFYRADVSRHTNGGLHAGLGLAIVKGCVDLLGGTIRVKSTVGEGTSFRVEIPPLTANS